MRRRIVEFFMVTTTVALLGIAPGRAQTPNTPAAGQAPKPAAATAQALWPAPPPPAAAAKTAPLIPIGTVVRVQLGSTLTDATNKAGDKFDGIVDKPVVVKGKVIIPKYSQVYGHVAFVKPAGRIMGKGEMRIVLDKIVTPNNTVYPLTGSLHNGQVGDCGNGKKAKGKSRVDSEGMIHGCGKSKKAAAKATAILAGMGAAGGATIGLATRGGCYPYYGCYPSQGPGVGTDVMYGAGIGAGTALIYELLKHEKHIILVEGTDLNFVINRAVAANRALTASTVSN